MPFTGCDDVTAVTAQSTVNVIQKLLYCSSLIVGHLSVLAELDIDLV